MRLDMHYMADPHWEWIWSNHLDTSSHRTRRTSLIPATIPRFIQSKNLNISPLRLEWYPNCWNQSESYTSVTCGDQTSLDGMDILDDPTSFAWRTIQLPEYKYPSYLKSNTDNWTTPEKRTIQLYRNRISSVLIGNPDCWNQYKSCD